MKNIPSRNMYFLTDFAFLLPYLSENIVKVFAKYILNNLKTFYKINDILKLQIDKLQILYNQK